MNMKNLIMLFSLVFHISAALADVVIYMQPMGNDEASGKTEAEPVRTLRVAIQRALDADARPGENRRVVVGSGNYVGQSIVIKNLPAEQPLTISAKSGDKAIFDGEGKVRTWLVLESSLGKPSRLTIHNLEVTNYVTAISLNGDRSSRDLWNGNNIIRDNTFRNIGQIAIPSGPPSQAVIRLVNSRDNKIVNNTFINILNISGCSGLHAIYMAHYSSYNSIEKNTFEKGCGATVKARDASNFNIIRNNRFIDQADTVFLDSYCDKDTRSDCTKETAECPSWGNQVENNIADRLGSRARKTPTAALGPDYPTGCQKPPGAVVRFSSSNNKFQ